MASVAEIRALGGWDPLESHRLEFEGVATHFDPERRLLVLQDETGAVALDLGDAKVDVASGQRVRVVAGDCRPLLLDLPRFPDRPDRRDLSVAFSSSPPESGSYFVERFRGLVRPPTTGEYRFFIASDDASRLLLGTDDTPATRRCVAWVSGFCDEQDWDRTPGQRSVGIPMEAGRSYYIEVLHEQLGGATHLAVAWEGPGFLRQMLSGDCLSSWPDERWSPAGADQPGDRSAPRVGALLHESWRGVALRSLDLLLQARTLDSVLSVSGADVTVLGPAPLPTPLDLDYSRPVAARDGFRWARMEGRVDFLSLDSPQPVLELNYGGAPVRVFLDAAFRSKLGELNGRTVRVTGVVELVARVQAGLVPGSLRVPSTGSLELLDQSPRRDLARPTTIAALTYRSHEFARGAAVRVAGTVVGVEDGHMTIADTGTVVASCSIDGEQWSRIGDAVDISMPDPVVAGLAVHSSAPTRASRAVFSGVQGLDEGPSLVDVGGGAGGGRYAREGGRVLVDGVGSDIWDAPDKFTFVHSERAGTVVVSACLESFDSPEPRSRAGLMIRESLAPDAQFVDVVRTVVGGEPALCLQYRWGRSGQGTRSVAMPGFDPTKPIWLRLERRFNTVAVRSPGAEGFQPGDQVDVCGYAEWNRDQPEIVAAAVAMIDDDPRKGSGGIESWRPLVPVGNLRGGDQRWMGLDYFSIRGVVTFCGDVLGRRYRTLQDASAGVVFVPRVESALFDVEPGTLVEIASNPGWSPPSDVLYADNLLRLGRATFPRPIKHPAEVLLPERGEGTWIELVGVARAVSDRGVVEVNVQGELFDAVVVNASPERLAELVDGEVRLRGVVVYPTERERLLLVPGREHVEVIRPAPSDPFAAAIEGDLVSAEGAHFNRARHRVRVRGTVTCAEAGAFFVQSDSRAYEVELAAALMPALGASVEVVGFPEWGDRGCVVLRHSLLRPGPVMPVLLPAEVDPGALVEGTWAGKLVRVRGRVANPDGWRAGSPLELESGDRVVRIGFPAGRDPAGRAPRGSVVEVTGISVGASGEGGRFRDPDHDPANPRLRLLLRDRADFAVLSKPSWWVVERALLALSGVGIFASVSMIWIYRLRRRVRQRTAELEATMAKLRRETSIAATLAERDRLAGEIHDSLEQGLNGIILQLESTAGEKNCPPEVRSGLELAANMASFSRAEVQHAVWELQSPMLENSNLPAALEKIMHQIVPSTVDASVRVVGAPRRLASDTEHHLLRIAQEAMNNVVKHAAARHLQVTVDFGGDSVELAVRDDGCGFDVAGVSTGGLGHFGLRSLRSRVGRIRGLLDIESVPGRGTTIRVRVPTPES